MLCSIHASSLTGCFEPSLLGQGGSIEASIVNGLKLLKPTFSLGILSPADLPTTSQPRGHIEAIIVNRLRLLKPTTPQPRHLEPAFFNSHHVFVLLEFRFIYFDKVGKSEASL
jgi:hypothetical protein